MRTWQYGLLGAPLAFLSLPLYVALPRYYAEHYALALSSLGLLLLLTRLLDASLDPFIGRWVDRLFAQSTLRAWRVAVVGAIAVGIGFAALWMPWHMGSTALWLWLGAMLVCTYIGFSIVAMVHMTWAARWGGSPQAQAAWVSAREGAALLGVIAASLLPLWLGYAALSITLMLLLCIGLLCLKRTAHLHAASPVATHSLPPAPPLPRPWQLPAFNALLVVFLFNGTASAIPATLLPFFVRDTLNAPSWEPAFLLIYFVAAGLGMPLWLRLIGRWGLARVWMLGMATSVLAFCAVPWLSTGDTTAFAIVCALTGLALGADLAVPGALLTHLIHRSGLGQQAEGSFFGWWTSANKLNLALASGLALPLLEWSGYVTARRTDTDQLALALSYGLLPCLFKLVALALLWAGARRHPVLKGLS